MLCKVVDIDINVISDITQPTRGHGFDTGNDCSKTGKLLKYTVFQMRYEIYKLINERETRGNSFKLHGILYHCGKINV